MYWRCGQTAQDIRIEIHAIEPPARPPMIIEYHGIKGYCSITHTCLYISLAAAAIGKAWSSSSPRASASRMSFCWCLRGKAGGKLRDDIPGPLSLNIGFAIAPKSKTCSPVSRMYVCHAKCPTIASRRRAKSFLWIHSSFCNEHQQAYIAKSRQQPQRSY